MVFIWQELLSICQGNRGILHDRSKGIVGGVGIWACFRNREKFLVGSTVNLALACGRFQSSKESSVSAPRKVQPEFNKR